MGDGFVPNGFIFGPFVPNPVQVTVLTCSQTELLIAPVPHRHHRGKTPQDRGRLGRCHRNHLREPADRCLSRNPAPSASFQSRNRAKSMAKPTLSLFSHGCEQRSPWVKAALSIGVSSAPYGCEQRSVWMRATLSMGVSNALYGCEQRSVWVRATLPMGESGAQYGGEQRSVWEGATLPMGVSAAEDGARRGTCMVGGKAAAEAAALTHGAVR